MCLESTSTLDYGRFFKVTFVDICTSFFIYVHVPSILNLFAECAVSQVFSDCCAPAICDRSCSNLNDPIACPAVCVARCCCPPGQVFNDIGICIPADTCPPPPCTGVVCPPGEVCNELTGTCEREIPRKHLTEIIL